MTAAPASVTRAVPERINGVDVAAVARLVLDARLDPANAVARLGVTTRWVDGAVSDTHVRECEIGGRRVKRDFRIRADEPLELAGSDKHANPQEYLLAAFNACMLVGYVVVASLQGIELERVEIESGGEIDLRGLLGLDAGAKPGYDRVHYTVRIKGNGTPAQFAEIHRTVTERSPNRFSLASPIRVTSDLVIG